MPGLAASIIQKPPPVDVCLLSFIAGCNGRTIRALLAVDRIPIEADLLVLHHTQLCKGVVTRLNQLIPKIPLFTTYLQGLKGKKYLPSMLFQRQIFRILAPFCVHASLQGYIRTLRHKHI